MKHNDSLATLMQSLYYPAALGTGLVWSLERIAQNGFLLEANQLILNFFAALLVLYFSVSFLMMNSCIKARMYGPLAFILDSVEAILVLFAFYYLRTDLGENDEPQIARFYLVLIPIPIIAGLWNHFVVGKSQPIWLQVACFIIVILLSIGVYQGGECPLYNWFMAASVFCVIIAYLLKPR